MRDCVPTGWEVTGVDLGTLVAEVAEVAAMADAVISAASCGGACRRHGRPLRCLYHHMPTSPYRRMPVSPYVAARGRLYTCITTCSHLRHPYCGLYRRMAAPLPTVWALSAACPYRCTPVSLYVCIGPESDGHTLPTITTTTY